jgi:hypothetical protein
MPWQKNGAKGTKEQVKTKREQNIMRLCSIKVFFMLTIIMMVSVSEGAASSMKVSKLDLPQTIGVWTRNDLSRVINSKNIFDYMNGAGELYLSYRFDHLEVYEYKADHEKSILVELYYMKTSDDAFGLLSLDWGGERISFGGSPANASNDSLASSTKALYGAGLLRIWSDDLYSRVMAFRETSAAKKAVLALGKAIVANRKTTPKPALLKVIPTDMGMGWKLRNDRVGYLRSHLVLNSLYYLSHQNILNLNLSTEAVTAPYDNISKNEDFKRIQFLFVKYVDSEQAQQALDNFQKNYLPEYKNSLGTDSYNQIANFFQIEDGWLGYRLYGPCIAFVFGCPDKEAARMIIDQTRFNLIEMEDDYDK